MRAQDSEPRQEGREILIHHSTSARADSLTPSSHPSTKPGRVWTAPTVQGKNDADDCSIGRRHVSGLFDAACMPLALMRSADRVPINSPSSELRPVFGLSQSSVTTDMHQLLFTSRSPSQRLSRRRRCLVGSRQWLSVILLSHHDRPGDPRHLVGQRQRDQPEWASFQQ